MKKEFMIGGWLAPENTVEAYRLAKGCGINTMYLLGGACKFAGDDEQIDAIKACKGAGVNAIPLVTHRRMTFKDERFMDYDNVPAVMLRDEPSAEEYPMLEEKMEEFYQFYPKTMRCEINLLPNYATLNQLKAESYFDYVQRYMEIHERKLPEGNVLSVDHYPIFKKGDGVAITPLWLRCLSTLTYFSRRKNLPTHCFLQTMAFGAGNDVQQNFNSLRLQFMVYFAFGFRGFTHFCYASPGIDAQFLPHQEAIIGRDRQPSKLYEEVRKANELAQTFAESYLPYTHQGTRAYAPEGERVEAFEDWCEEVDFGKTSLKAVTTDCPLLIGKFNKEEKTEAFFVTHYAWIDGKQGKAKIAFDGKKKLVLHYDGKTEERVCEVLELALEAGNGIFIEVNKEN